MRFQNLLTISFLDTKNITINSTIPVITRIYNPDMEANNVRHSVGDLGSVPCRFPVENLFYILIIYRIRASA